MHKKHVCSWWMDNTNYDVLGKSTEIIPILGAIALYYISVFNNSKGALTNEVQFWKKNHLEYSSNSVYEWSDTVVINTFSNNEIVIL